MPPGPPSAAPEQGRPWAVALGWALGALLSGYLSLQASQWPALPAPAPLPPARPRPLSPAEAAALEVSARAFQGAIDAARAALGRWPAVAELEGSTPQGAPILPQGIPDNPAVDGVGWVVDFCGVDGEPPGPDWLYCQATGRVRAARARPRSADDRDQ